MLNKNFWILLISWGAFSKRSLEAIMKPVVEGHCRRFIHSLFSNWFFYSLFHFIRRFWNHILICVSVSSKLDAISMRRVLVKYLLKWNSFSNSTSCRWVKVNRFFWLTVVWFLISGLVSSFSETLAAPAVRRHENETKTVKNKRTAIFDTLLTDFKSCHWVSKRCLFEIIDASN